MSILNTTLVIKQIQKHYNQIQFSLTYCFIANIKLNMSEVIVLYDGYSIVRNNEEMSANCTCTLIKGIHNIIIDTMTPWDAKNIITALKKQDIATNSINYVICTHGHSDHTGNNNLFLNAKHLVGFSLSFKDNYYTHPFDKGEEYIINENVKVIPTPGHTLSDVTVLVTTQNKEIVAVTGDLFEKFEDIEDPSIWLEAGSENPGLQVKNRSLIADIANWIVPGHGPKFQVTDVIRAALSSQLVSNPY